MLSQTSIYLSDLLLYITPIVSQQRGKCPSYKTKQSDGETQVKLETWRMQSTRSLTSLLGSLRPGVVVRDKVLSMGQIQLFDI